MHMRLTPTPYSSSLPIVFFPKHRSAHPFFITWSSAYRQILLHLFHENHQQFVHKFNRDVAASTSDSPISKEGITPSGSIIRINENLIHHLSILIFIALISNGFQKHLLSSPLFCINFDFSVAISLTSI